MSSACLRLEPNVHLSWLQFPQFPTVVSLTQCIHWRDVAKECNAARTRVSRTRVSSWDAGSCRKLQTKWFTMMVNFFSLIHFWTLLPWWIFDTSADLLLFVLLISTVNSTTMWPHHSHNIFGLPLFLWHFTFPSSNNFFNGWFRLHVRNNLFCLFNKVPDLTTAMYWFVVCSVHDTQNISRYNLFIFKCIYAFLHVFGQGPRFTSMWQLKICTFIMRCLIVYRCLWFFGMPLPTSVWFCSISSSFYQWPNIF